MKANCLDLPESTSPSRRYGRSRREDNRPSYQDRRRRSRSREYDRYKKHEKPRSYQQSSPRRRRNKSNDQQRGVVYNSGGFTDVGSMPGVASIGNISASTQQKRNEEVKRLPDYLNKDHIKAARELMITNLPPALDVNHLVDYLNAVIKEAGISVGAPVVKAWVAADAKVAFIELKTIEEATLALQLNGLLCLGYNLKFDRPRTCSKELSSPKDKEYKNKKSISTLNTYNLGILGKASAPQEWNEAVMASERIVILNLRLDKASCLELLTTFGFLRCFIYINVKDDYLCVIEYDNTDSYQLSLRTLNNLVIADQKVKAIEGGDALRKGYLYNYLQKYEICLQLLGEIVRPEVPTKVLMISNLVLPGELVDNKEYLEILEDVRLECQEKAPVVDIQVPRPPAGGIGPNYDLSDVGIAFVLFENIGKATKTRKFLDGRRFNRRLVEVHYFSEEKFKLRDFKNPKPNYF